jgi:hypothetical protein
MSHTFKMFVINHYKAIVISCTAANLGVNFYLLLSTGAHHVH